VARVGFGDDRRCVASGGCANRVGLIVAMEGVERHRHPGLACLPLGSLPDGSVGDLAQRTVPSAEPGPDPIGEFATHGAVGVIDANEAHDSVSRCLIGRSHCDSIADRRHFTGVISAEPFASRWKRRARTIPLMLAVTFIALLASPVILIVATVIDLAKGRLRLPTVRVTLFLLQYAINDSIEILLAPVYWTMAGVGTRVDRPNSVRRHERLQCWSIAVLARRAERLLGLRIEIDAESTAALTPGPVIVLCRHVNIVDASLPTLLYQRLGYRSRGVIMAELLADPGFDLIYGRTGSVFIPRESGPQARAAVREVGQGIDARTAVVIFPEGRLFRPDRLERARARLAVENPDRGARLAPLSHVLPPRPGGVLALVDTIRADVVVIAHSGLDHYASFTELAKVVPLRNPLQVTAWRVPADEIPASDDERIAWLDEQWLRVDDWVARQRATAKR
jgi:1-acyl-sn-glycerol-3-phosphate acyltransferase